MYTKDAHKILTLLCLRWSTNAAAIYFARDARPTTTTVQLLQYFQLLPRPGT